MLPVQSASSIFVQAMCALEIRWERHLVTLIHVLLQIKLFKFLHIGGELRISMANLKVNRVILINIDCYDRPTTTLSGKCDVTKFS
jgi:hypothetical protein